MGTRFGKWLDFVDESDWRFGLALTAISVVQITLLLVVTASLVSK
jgi:hypothetical protein